MGIRRSLRLVWVVTWFNVRMLLASEFFILTTFISPLIFATLAFLLFESGGGTAGQTLLYVALGTGMMGVWSTTLFGCGGAIAWQRWEGTLELLVSAPTRYDLILANILARPLSLLARDLARTLAPGGVAPAAVTWAMP